MEYANAVNAKEYKWTVYIGMPFGTSYWQFGDSAEQNGSFKISLSCAKTELVQKRAQASLEYALEKSDIVIIVKAV